MSYDEAVKSGSLTNLAITPSNLRTWFGLEPTADVIVYLTESPQAAMKTWLRTRELNNAACWSIFPMTPTDENGLPGTKHEVLKFVDTVSGWKKLKVNDGVSANLSMVVLSDHLESATTDQGRREYGPGRANRIRDGLNSIARTNDLEVHWLPVEEASTRDEFREVCLSGELTPRFTLHARIDSKPSTSLIEDDNTPPRPSWRPARDPTRSVTLTWQCGPPLASLSTDQISAKALSNVLIDPAKLSRGSIVIVKVRPCSQAPSMIAALEMYETQRACEYATAGVEYRIVPPRGYIDTKSELVPEDGAKSHPGEESEV